jgi:hypothetical protein
VHLTLEDGLVGGLANGQPVRLKVEEKDRALALEGSMLGTYVNLQVGPEKLSGKVGACGYELKAVGERYEGSRSCGGAPQPGVWVSIPGQLTQQGNAATAAALTLLLAH